MLKPIGKQRVAEEIVQQLRTLFSEGTTPPGTSYRRSVSSPKSWVSTAPRCAKPLRLWSRWAWSNSSRRRYSRPRFHADRWCELVSHLVAGTADGIPSIEVLEDVLEFRRIFARDVAYMAAEKATAEDLQRLDEIAKRAESELTADELLKLDFEFYLELTRCAKNRVFQLLINTIRAAVTSHAVFFAQVSLGHPWCASITAMFITAIKAREADKAAKAVNDYLFKAQEMLGALFPGKSRIVGGAAAAGEVSTLSS